MSKPTLFYCESDMGCGIRSAYSLNQAVREFRAEAGTYVQPRVRYATRKDVDWVAAMGGHVPTGNCRKVSQEAGLDRPAAE